MTAARPALPSFLPASFHHGTMAAHGHGYVQTVQDTNDAPQGEASGTDLKTKRQSQNVPPQHPRSYPHFVSPSLFVRKRCGQLFGEACAARPVVGVNRRPHTVRTGNRISVELVHISAGNQGAPGVIRTRRRYWLWVSGARDQRKGRCISVELISSVSRPS